MHHYLSPYSARTLTVTTRHRFRDRSRSRFEQGTSLCRTVVLSYCLTGRNGIAGRLNSLIPCPISRFLRKSSALAEFQDRFLLLGGAGFATIILPIAHANGQLQTTVHRRPQPPKTQRFLRVKRFEIQAVFTPRRCRHQPRPARCCGWFRASTSSRSPRFRTPANRSSP